MKICPQCQAQWSDNNTYCQYCSAQLHVLLPGQVLSEADEDHEDIWESLKGVFMEDTPSFSAQRQPLAYPQSDIHRPNHVTVNSYLTPPNSNNVRDDFFEAMMGIVVFIAIAAFFTGILYAPFFYEWLRAFLIALLN